MGRSSSISARGGRPRRARQQSARPTSTQLRTLGGGMKVWIRQVMAYRHPVHSPMPFPVPGWMWDRPVGVDLYDKRLAYIRRLEALGFDGAIFTEHHYGTIGGL